MLGILPRGHDVSLPSPTPLWRDFSVDRVESVTWALVGRGAAEISERLHADAGMNSEHWMQLLRPAWRSQHSDCNTALTTLEATEPQIADQQARAALWVKLSREILHHHRQFADAHWSLPVDVLERLEMLYEKFAPSDPLEQNAWLFRQGVPLPDPGSGGWETETRDVDDARQKAAHAIYEKGGIPDILELARMTDSPGFVGKALVESGLSSQDLEALLKTSIRSGDAKERDVADGIIVTVIRDRQKGWGAALIERARTEAWGDTALLAMLRAFPLERSTWNLAEEIGGQVEAEYWRRTPVYWMDENGEDVSYAISKLIGAGRARHALALVNGSKTGGLSTELIVDVLKQAALQPIDNVSDGNDAAMFQHNVAEALQLLDRRDDVDRKDFIWLEWNYLPLLEHSCSVL